MSYPFKYPRLYGELAMQGKTKKGLANALQITTVGLRNRQNLKTECDFRGEEMKAAASYLKKPLEYLFTFQDFQ